MRVLLAEDHPAVAEISVNLLRDSFGHEVRLVRSGQDVLPAALDYRPDLILIDIGLPDLDGFAVARRIRQDRRFERTILVALTGYSGESDRQLAYRSGFDAHYAKPMDFSVLESIRRRSSEGET